MFQDLDIEMMIGRGHKDNGLYLLDVPFHLVSPVQQIPSSIKDNKVCSQQLSQWHNRLGHHSLLSCFLVPIFLFIVNLASM